MKKNSDSENVPISVVAVCYNSVDSMEKTIKSVLFQDYPGIEYIVIDGCSNDGTTDIMYRYEECFSSKCVDYYISEPDNG